MASNRREYGQYSNGGTGRPPQAAPSHQPSSSRQSVVDGNSTDVESFKLTRLLGEATYKYAKMKEAESEKIQADNDWTKNQQHFESNPKLKETYDFRRNKMDRKFGVAKRDYIRTAQDAEPLLRKIEEDSTKDTTDRAQVARIFSEEARERGFVTSRRLKDDIHDAGGRMLKESELLLKQGLRDYVHKTEFEKLSDQVKNMNLNPRSRQMSVSSDFGSREVEQLRKELSKEVRNLNDRIGRLQNGVAPQPDRRISLIPTVKVEDIVKIETAVEKAQEVINDQYINLQDLRLQVESVLEGIRVLNEHIEEYDKRLDGLQSGTQKFFAEVKFENERRNAILTDALEKLHTKIATDINAKIDSSPITPSSASFAPFTDNFRQQQLLEIHANNIREHGASLKHLNGRTTSLENQVNKNLVPKPHIDEMATRLGQTQLGFMQLSTEHTTLANTFNQYRQHQSQLNQNTENNFRETAIHMDMVKRRFGQHRTQLDELIESYKSSQDQMDILIGQHNGLQEMMQSRVIPMLARVVKQFPEVAEEAGRNQSASSTARPETAVSRQTLAVSNPQDPTVSPNIARRMENALK